MIRIVQRGLINQNVYWIKMIDIYCLIVDDIAVHLLEKGLNFTWKITLGVQGNGVLLVPILVKSKQRILINYLMISIYKCHNLRYYFFLNKKIYIFLIKMHLKPYAILTTHNSNILQKTDIILSFL